MLLLTLTVLVTAISLLILLTILVVMIIMLFEIRKMRSEIDVIFDTCTNVEELMAITAEREGIISAQN